MFTPNGGICLWLNAEKKELTKKLTTRKLTRRLTEKLVSLANTKHVRLTEKQKEATKRKERHADVVSLLA